MGCGGFVPAKGAALVPGQAVAPTSVYGEVDHYARISLNEVHHFVLVETNTSLWRSIYIHGQKTCMLLILGQRGAVGKAYSNVLFATYFSKKYVKFIEKIYHNMVP